jgi:cell division protein FtsB
MEFSPFIWITLVVAIIFIPPVLLLRPLVVSIADKIAGKHANADELKALKTRVLVLEQEVTDLRTRCITLEDTHEFTKKLSGETPRS